MNRQMMSIICIGIFLSTTVLSCRAPRRTNKVLLLPREGASADPEFMLTRELGVMKQLLEKDGFEVAIASSTGEPIFSRRKSVQPDLKLSEVNVEEYCGIIIPCMAVGTGLPLPEAVDIVRKAVDQGKPVAAQFNSIIILAAAGVLKGKKYASFGERPRYTEGFESAIYAGSGVVQDGNIITSGVCPWMAKTQSIQDNTAKLTQTFIAELKRRK